MYCFVSYVNIALFQYSKIGRLKTGLICQLDPALEVIESFEKKTGLIQF